MNSEQWRAFLSDHVREMDLDPAVANRLAVYVEKLLGQDLPVVFDLEHLSRLCGIRRRKMAAIIFSPSSFYRRFAIKKSNGGTREISAPNLVLKECQRWILSEILEKIRLPDCVQGFAIDRSIVTNARIHINKPMVVNVDIRDFFPSIKSKRVFNLFRQLGYGKDISFYLTRLTTLDGALPQGAPTSPMISNAVVRHLDIRLSRLAHEGGHAYSRYADDLTFSGASSLISMLPLIQSIVKEEGFDLNPSKTRIMRSHKRQEVTGLVVNHGVAINRGHRRWLRQQVHYMRKFGPEDCARFMESSKKNRREFFYGHAFFVRMVDRAKGDALLRELDATRW